MTNAITFTSAALLNSLWQGVVLALFMWIAMRITRSQMNAATRHIIWWIVLGAILVLPTIPRRAPSPSAPHAASRPSMRALPIAVSVPLQGKETMAAVTITEKRSAAWPLWAFGIWASIFAFRMARLLRSFLHLRRIKARGTASPHPLPVIGRHARLLISSEISSPVATGFLNPAVILPDNLFGKLTDGELNCVLLHESAHLARFDDWANLIARLVDIGMALHPVVWWVRRQIEREREMACDDWAVAHSGRADVYAGSLARMVELRAVPSRSALATGIFTKQSRLRERVEMVLRHGREFSPMASRIWLAGAGGALVTLTAAGILAPHWIAFAQRPEFEVASVKRNVNNGQMDVTPRRSGDLIIMHNIQPYSVIYYAYHLQGSYQMVGYQRLPDGWNWYDIDARAGAGATEDQVRLMFQSLLEDRFKLKVRRETRDVPEYELVVKGKTKLTTSSENR
ncbi:MAG TPA: M56 family metallopeptidase [Bryobacteraceae bacterium]|nr:M56 family metallopeptidase [Bryobacteraceae bacterium]